MGRLAAAGLIVILSLAGFGAWSMAVAKQNALLSTAPELVTMKARARPRALEETVVRAPLSQELFNLYYVDRYQEYGPESSRTAELAVLLARLGWRSTPAQQNLLVHAVQDRGDLKTLVDRADALLRRQKIEAGAREFLYLFENDPRSLRYLLIALRRKPEWRQLFLTEQRGLATPARVMARANTVAAMQRQGIALERAELAPVLNRLAQIGLVERAYALWIGSRPRGEREKSVIQDSKFELAASAALDDQPQYPFEWQLESGRGYRASVAGAAGSNELHLRWDGRGVPVLARQRLILEPGVHVVRIQGLDAKPEAMGALQVLAQCPRRTVTFSTVSSSVDTRGGLLMRSDEPIPCRFPEFLIAGNPGDNPRAIEISLSSIAMTRI